MRARSDPKTTASFGPAESLARVLTVALIAVAAVVSTWAASGLYADGAFFALKIFLLKTFWLGDESRIYGHYVTQLPMIAALQSGIDDLNLLIRFHTAGLQLVLIGWIGALLIQIRDRFFWSLVFCFCVSYLSSGFFIIGEYNFAAALTGLMAAALLRSRPLHVGVAGIVVLCAIGLIRAYETTAFLGPLLMTMCLARLLLLGGESKIVTALLLVSVVLLAVGTAVAAYAILFPVRPLMLAGAANVWPLLHSAHAQFLAGIGLLMIVALRLRGTLYIGMVVTGIVMSLVYVLRMPWWNPPVRHYDFRALSGLFVLAILGVNAVFFYGERFGLMVKWRSPDALGPMVLSCFIALLVPFLSHLVGFRSWATTFEKTASQGEGVIPIERTSLVPSRYVWNWTNPTLSAVLTGDRLGVVIENPAGYHDWEPFAAGKTPILQTYRKSGPLYQSRDR